MKTRIIDGFNYITKKCTIAEGDFIYDKANHIVYRSGIEHEGSKGHVVMESNDPTLLKVTSPVEDSDTSGDGIPGLPAILGRDIDTQHGIVTKLEDPNDHLFLKCPNCGGIHFRHAGYVLPLTAASYKSSSLNLREEVSAENVPVNLCITCKSAIVSHGGKISDMTAYVDLEAWSKTEKELHKATGPGGQC